MYHLQTEENNGWTFVGMHNIVFIKIPLLIAYIHRPHCSLLFTWRRVYGRFGSKFIVEVGDVVLALELGHEGGRHPPLEHLVPLDPGEEPVLPDGQGVPLPRPQPLLHGPVEQPLDDVLGIWGQVVLELELAPKDPLRDGLPVVSGEWGRASEHVVNQDPETPPVNLLTMPTVENKQYESSTKVLYNG